MSYKTVLVHLNDERRAAHMLDYAVPFAQAHQAHLIGLFVVPLPVVLNEWPDIAIAEMIEAQRKAYRDEGARIAAVFKDKTSEMTRPSEWRLIESQYATAAEALVQHARLADIAIAPQADRGWHLTHTLDCAESAIMESGRPVLVIPNAGEASPEPSRVTVAWNGKREATRAVFDALPIIAKAGRADVVWIDPRPGSAAAGDLPGSDLAVMLARHGVQTEAKSVAAADESVGSALKDEVRRSGSGLLVMGAYGHSRLRELVLGGATRNIMQSMTVPVLFSH